MRILARAHCSGVVITALLMIQLGCITASTASHCLGPNDQAAAEQSPFLRRRGRETGGETKLLKSLAFLGGDLVALRGGAGEKPTLADVLDVLESFDLSSSSEKERKTRSSVGESIRPAEEERTREVGAEDERRARREVMAAASGRRLQDSETGSRSSQSAGPLDPEEQSRLHRERMAQGQRELERLAAKYKTPAVLEYQKSLPAKSALAASQPTQTATGTTDAATHYQAAGAGGRAFPADAGAGHALGLSRGALLRMAEERGGGAGEGEGATDTVLTFQVRVPFDVGVKGRRVKVVGGHAMLGEWNITNAPELFAHKHAGDIFRADVVLKADAWGEGGMTRTEYKYAIGQEVEGEDGVTLEYTWEDRIPNRKLGVTTDFIGKRLVINDKQFDVADPRRVMVPVEPGTDIDTLPTLDMVPQFGKSKMMKGHAVAQVADLAAMRKFDQVGNKKVYAGLSEALLSGSGSGVCEHNRERKYCKACQRSVLGLAILKSGRDAGSGAEGGGRVVTDTTDKVAGEGSTDTADKGDKGGSEGKKRSNVMDIWNLTEELRKVDKGATEEPDEGANEDGGDTPEVPVSASGGGVERALQDTGTCEHNRQRNRCLTCVSKAKGLK